MLIIGAKGFAKEVLEVLFQNKDLENIAFYDDVNVNVPELLYDKFPVLKTKEAARKFFQNSDKRFTIGIGNPVLRKKMNILFTDLGGIFTSTISPLANIGNFGNEIGQGCNIMTGTVITNDIKIGNGVLINLNCTVGHDTPIGDFVEMSPGVHISGNCEIGAFSILGTNSTVLPKVKIGRNVIVGAGCVVTKDVPDNSLVVGVPGKIIKELPSLNFN